MRTSVKDVDQHEMVRKIADFLKKSNKVKLPEQVDLVKTAKFKELAPIDPDWFYIRTAAIARRLYIRSPAGVGAFQRVFGGKRRDGTAPNHFCKSSSGVIRKALQALEGLKWVEKNTNGNGRVISKRGRKDLDLIATHVRQEEKAAALVLVQE